MKYAQIVDGVVANVVEWDGESEFDIVGELVDCEKVFVDVGDSFKDGKFKRAKNKEAPTPTMEQRLEVVEEMLKKLGKAPL